MWRNYPLCKSPRSVAGNGPRLVDQDALHLWSFLCLQGRRLWLRDRQVRLREWGLRRQGQRRVPLWANLQVRQRLLRVLHGQVLQHGQLPTGPCDHPPPTRLLGAASGPERSPPPPLLGCRREHLVASPTSPMPLPVSTQVRVRRLLPQVAVHDAVLGRPRHGRRRPRDGRHHRHDLCQDEVKLKPEGAVSGHRRRAVA